LPQAAHPPLSAEQLSPRSDRDRVDRVLAGFLDEARRRFAPNPHAQPLFDQAIGFVLQGGKRIRPRLCLASYRILSDRLDPPRPVVKAAACFELFHAFMLVHDDLIDGSTLRREGLALHEQIRLSGPAPDSAGSRKRAADLGLVAGDLLCALGMRQLARAGLSDAVHARASRLMADILLETGVGQTLDILLETAELDSLSESQILDAYLRKTSRYSVSGPLVLGAILAGASERVIRALGRFGDLLGLGYQLQNDLDALEHDPARGGDFPDLDGGKRTWVLWMAYRGLDADGRAGLVNALADPVGLARRIRLWRLIQASGAIAAGRERLETWRDEAMAALRGVALTAQQRRSLFALIGLLPGRLAPAGVSGANHEPAYAGPSLLELPEKATA
jgi:geranylgeranyl diphosphate synthase type I